MHRITAYGCDIVGIGVTAGETENALSDKVDHLMVDLAGFAVVDETAGDLLGETKPIVSSFEK
jgi:hypothetical protein